MHGLNFHSALFSIGHSNQPLDAFLTALEKHEIQVLVDVRSSPYSRYSPHYNREELQALLKVEGMQYLFLGNELGGRPEAAEFYAEDGRVLYSALAQSPLFQQGIRRLEEGASRYRIAVMCSEEDPTGCHRYLLIGRVLAERGINLCHIRGDGRVQTDDELAPLESQPLLFTEMEEDRWKSIRSVSPKRAPLSSSES